MASEWNERIENAKAVIRVRYGDPGIIQKILFEFAEVLKEPEPDKEASEIADRMLDRFAGHPEREPADMMCPNCGGDVHKVRINMRPIRYVCEKCNETTHLPFKVKRTLGEVVDLTGVNPAPPLVRNPEGNVWLMGLHTHTQHDERWMPKISIGPNPEPAHNPFYRFMTPTEAFRPGAVALWQNTRHGITRSIEGPVTRLLISNAEFFITFDGIKNENYPVKDCILVKPAPEDAT